MIDGGVSIMDKYGDKYCDVDITGNDAILQKVIRSQHQSIDSTSKIATEVRHKTHTAISSSEELLKSLGRALPDHRHIEIIDSKPTIKLRSWHEIVVDAEATFPSNIAITDLLSDNEIMGVEQRIGLLRNDFDLQHKLDWLDYGIAGISGTMAALVDIFLVKLPSSKGLLGSPGTEGGTLSDFFRNHLRSKFSPQEISRLEKNNWVPYDSSTSKNLAEKVAGLGPRSHRFQSLGVPVKQFNQPIFRH